MNEMYETSVTRTHWQENVNECTKRADFLENGSHYVLRLVIALDQHSHLKSLLANMKAKQRIQ